MGIVDDETRFLKAIARRLKLRGLDVRTASNGPDALDLARREAFEVALLDLKMPGMDGAQLLQALKRLDPLLEVVILTGHGSQRGAAELSALGAFGYLPKPYELNRLTGVLAAAFAERQRRRYANDAARLARLPPEEEDPLVRLQALRALDRD